MFIGSEGPKKVYDWWFSQLNYNNKGTAGSFSGYKTLSNVWLLSLEVKL